MIYLASSSPRRRELLAQLGVRFEVIAPEISEQPRAGEPARDYVARLARTKAVAGTTFVRARGWPARPVLAADTEVVLDGEILGKPRDHGHAVSMLSRLSGRTHEVLTAVAVLHQDELREALVESRVTFTPLSSDDIERYWRSGEPADKAGAYGIQGRAGAFVSRIEGSYSAIVGLPLCETAQLLAHYGIRSA